MDRSSAAAFVYAKASGMLAKSFVGKRAVKLFETRRLAELWAMLFETETPLVPESILAEKLECAAEEAFVNDFTRLLRCYPKPDPVSLALLQSYEYNNLKEIASALRNGETTLPQVVRIGRYELLHYKAFPNIKKMTHDTPLAWYDHIPSVEEEVLWENRLDVQYIHTLWNAVQHLPKKDRIPVSSLISEEIILQNIIWALRLRIYYNMQPDEIVARLACAGHEAAKTDPLAGPAMHMLSFAIDTYADWEHWKYASLLNPHEDGVVWSPDPRWLQQAVNVRLMKSALSQFHRHPFTIDVLVSWFKIKQHELDMIRTAAEGIRLNVDDSQLKEFAGVGS